MPMAPRRSISARRSPEGASGFQPGSKSCHKRAADASTIRSRSFVKSKRRLEIQAHGHTRRAALSVSPLSPRRPLAPATTHRRLAVQGSGGAAACAGGSHRRHSGRHRAAAGAERQSDRGLGAAGAARLSRAGPGVAHGPGDPNAATLSVRINSIYLGNGGPADPDIMKGVATLNGRQIRPAGDFDLFSEPDRSGVARAGAPRPRAGARPSLRLPAPAEDAPLTPA